MEINDRRTTPTNLTIDDVDGVAHSYVITPHSTTAAMAPMLALGAAFAPLVTQLVVEQTKQQGLAKKGQEVDLVGILNDKTLWGQAGDNIGEGISKLSPQVLAGLFDYTLRDGKPMRVVGDRDAAYAGNMFEFMQAVVHIVRANKFLPF